MQCYLLVETQDYQIKHYTFKILKQLKSRALFTLSCDLYNFQSVKTFSENNKDPFSIWSLCHEADVVLRKLEHIVIIHFYLIPSHSSSFGKKLHKLSVTLATDSRATLNHTIKEERTYVSVYLSTTLEQLDR